MTVESRIRGRNKIRLTGPGTKIFFPFISSKPARKTERRLAAPTGRRSRGGAIHP